MISKLKYLVLLVVMGIISCEEKKEVESLNETDLLISEVEEKYAPDARVALFDIEAEERDGTYLLKGESNLPEAVNELKGKLQNENIKFTDSISVLPDSSGLEDKTMGVVKISVANLREEPKHSSQLVTQATMGMPLKVYKKMENWYYVQTPDGYLAWVDSGGLKNMTVQEFSTWKKTDKLIFTEAFGTSYKEADASSAMVGDLVAGAIMELSGSQSDFYEVRYPQGKKAFIKKAEALPYDQWLESLEQNKESLVETSKELMGLPYLWGGTSSKGVDCSGFTKTIYFMNGMILPRDASQQVHTGRVVDSTKNFENLAKGDLLFFGRPATDSTSERVVHVGMWIGDNQFIHSMGEVHISTFDTTATDFDEYNYNRYLRTKRVLGQESDNITYLRQNDIFTEGNSESSQAE